MTSMVARRDRIDADLHNMVRDEAADGSPLDPHRDYEAEYQSLSAQQNDCDRALFATYAQFLDRPSRLYQEPANPSAHLTPCSPAWRHRHRESRPSRTPTRHTSCSGLRLHMYSKIEYSRKNETPFAILKAANHGVLTAIGRGMRGILSVSNLDVMAYVFPDRDLANNLLGFLPFANLGCIGIFKPTSFHIFKGNTRTTILSGTRDNPSSLWTVPLYRDWRAGIQRTRVMDFARSIASHKLRSLDRESWISLVCSLHRESQIHRR